MIQLIITFYCKFINKKTNNIDYIKFKNKDSFFKWKQKKHITILSEWIEWVYILKNNIYTFKWNKNVAKIHNNKISHLNSIKEIKNYLLNL